MVKRIKKIKKRPRAAASPDGPAWWVPFDAEGQAAVWIHAHGETDDHSNCGPVVMCCERAVAPYSALAPDLVTRVDSYKAQHGAHLASWLEGGLQAMYFVLCDVHDADIVYQFGLPADRARPLLMGRVAHDHYRRPEYKYSAP